MKSGEKLGNLQDIPFWYHGTVDSFRDDLRKVEVVKSFGRKDFGRGFYLTSQYGVAVQWAKRKARIANARSTKSHVVSGMVTTFKIDFDNIEEFNVLDFGLNFSSAYLDFIVVNRLGSERILMPDLVYGLIADGTNLIGSLEAYQQQKIGLIEASRRISYTASTDQLCLRSQEFIDQHLILIKSEVI